MAAVSRRDCGRSGATPRAERPGFSHPTAPSSQTAGGHHGNQRTERVKLERKPSPLGTNESLGWVDQRYGTYKLVVAEQRFEPRPKTFIREPHAVASPYRPPDIRRPPVSSAPSSSPRPSPTIPQMPALQPATPTRNQKPKQIRSPEAGGRAAGGSRTSPASRLTRVVSCGHTCGESCGGRVVTMWSHVDLCVFVSPARSCRRCTQHPLPAAREKGRG